MSEHLANDQVHASDAAIIAKDPPAPSGWAKLIARIRAFVTWVPSHRVEALGTAGLMMALAFVVIGGLIWTDQGRDVLQSANDWYRGLILFTGLTVSLVILEGLILLLIKKDSERFDSDLLVAVGALSALIMGVIASFHNNVLVGIAVSFIGGFVGMLIAAGSGAFLDTSKPINSGVIGFLAGLILFCIAIAPNFFGDWIGSALALTLVILGWLFLIFAIAINPVDMLGHSGLQRVQAITPARGNRLTIADHQAAITQVRETFTKRLAGLRAALETSPHGYVFCWADYGLGVLVEDGEPRTVGVEDATVTSKNDRRTFRNGNDEPAVLMPRKQALEAALKTVGASYAQRAPLGVWPMAGADCDAAQPDAQDQVDRRGSQGVKKSARVAAVTALFDRGWGTAPQPHTGEDDKDIRITSRTTIRIGVGVRHPTVGAVVSLQPPADRRHGA